MVYGLLYVVRGEKALLDFRAKLEADQAEIKAQAQRKIRVEMPETCRG